MAQILRLRVKETAQEKGMSMNKLSQRSEVSYNVIQEIYRNPYRETTFHTLNRLAAVLGVPPTALLEDTPEEVAQEEMASRKKTR